MNEKKKYDSKTIGKVLSIVSKTKENHKTTDLAIKLGITQSHLSRLFSGQKNTNIGMIYAFSEEFGIKVSQFYELVEFYQGLSPDMLENEKHAETLREALIKIMENKDPQKLEKILEN